MIFRRRECPLPKTEAKRERPIRTRKYTREYGLVEWMAGVFFLLFLGVLLCYCLQLAAYRSASLYLEDALAASNLAAAVIDTKEYGRTHTIVIEDPQSTYEKFCAAVRDNLQLDEQWECSNKVLISGKVNVESFIIYNVKQGKVSVQEINDGTVIAKWQGNLGSVSAPNGALVESTGIYSELSFPVEGFLGVTVQAHKGKLVDIVTRLQQ